jgi:ABC-type lipoprotein release transport system permease subunit
VPGLGSIEAATVASSIGLMIAAALLAALLPARRASRFEAVEALRHD